MKLWPESRTAGTLPEMQQTPKLVWTCPKPCTAVLYSLEIITFFLFDGLFFFCLFLPFNGKLQRDGKDDVDNILSHLK